MAARIPVKGWHVLLLVKEIMVVKNATAYTWNLYCCLLGDRASLHKHAVIVKNVSLNVIKLMHTMCILFKWCPL
jgi:hypothetical protein